MQKNLPTITINGVPLPNEAVAFELQRLVKFHSEHMPREQIQAQMPEITKKAVEQAVGARLLMDEANRLDIPVTEADIDARIAKIEEDLEGPAELQKRLDAQRVTMPAFRENIRRGARVEKFIEQITADVAEPSDDDLRAHFDAHRDEYTRAERVLAQHILITPESDSEHAVETARQTVADLHAQLLGGADFATLAAKHSHCPSGAESGGSLGWFSRGMMVPEFEDAAFGMADKALSEPVKTQFGYHLIKRLDHEPAAAADFDDARETIRDFLRHHRRGEAISARVAQLRADARVEIRP
ncbi:MAG: peptidylprolyl isomerase [Kiritimatiellaeota bacterium]|nr:peptidylprolyl isomerase [Kiritimatiellota bacterium]